MQRSSSNKQQQQQQEQHQLDIILQALQSDVPTLQEQ